MRISDWSSDVCSSDLRFDADPARSYTLAAPYYFDPAVQGRENEAIFYRSWNYVAHVGQLAGVGRYVTARIGDQGIFVIPRKEDLKSVGLGKSVSVRVVLGDRRIIKKKQLFHNNQY